jgi:hypothetical protein
MMEYSFPDVRKDVQLLGSLPRGCCRVCIRCTEPDAEFRVLLPITGDEFIELLNSLFVSKVAGSDLGSTLVIADEPSCEFVAVYPRSIRRTVDYRS